MKFLKWLGIIVLSLIVLILVFINLAAFRFRMPDKSIAKHFQKAEVAFKIHQERLGDCEIRWVESGNLASDSLIFFSHGAPGGFSDFSKYMIDSQLVQQHRLIIMDRPGYGFSNYGKAEVSVVEQVEAARFVLEHYQAENLIVVGYSYGGPVAGSYAGRYPNKVKALLLLAPVIAPEGEKLFWFNSYLDSWGARLFLPKFIDVANEEKLFHAEALREIADDWKKIQAPVYHMHCMDDWIAPYEVNINWTKQNIPEEQLHLINWMGDSHFLPNNVKDHVDPVLQTIIKD
jgi:pimeloyl-ACP methyl ester carboxylesterase